MRECKHKSSLCDCIDWKNDDLALRLNHFSQNFEFAGFELEYTSLEAAEWHLPGRRSPAAGMVLASGPNDQSGAHRAVCRPLP